MNRSHRPHSFSSTYSRGRTLQVGLSASHSAVIVLRFVLPSFAQRPPSFHGVSPSKLAGRPFVIPLPLLAARQASLSGHLSVGCKPEPDTHQDYLTTN